MLQHWCMQWWGCTSKSSWSLNKKAPAVITCSFSTLITYRSKLGQSSGWVQDLLSVLCWGNSNGFKVTFLHYFSSLQKTAFNFNTSLCKYTPASMNMDKTSMLLTDASFKWLRTHQEVCVIEAISDQSVLVMSQAVFLQPLPDTQNPPRVYQTATDVDAYIQKVLVHENE